MTYRDRGTDELTSGYTDTTFNPTILMRRYRLTTPEQVVDFLSDTLLVAPLPVELRDRIIAYMNGGVTEQKFRGAVWLILSSPDYQRN